METYKFTKDSWWDYNGCSCCEPTEMEYYVPLGFDTNGTPHSIHECYTACIELVANPSEEEWEAIYDMDDDQLATHCREVYGFEVMIEEYIDERVK